MRNFDHFDKFKNEFFHHQEGYSEEKFLYNAMSAENVMKNGIKVRYFACAYDKEYNQIFNEDMQPITNDNPSNFAFDIKMMPDSLPSEDEQWSAFGQQANDTFKLYVNIETFSELAKRRIGTDYVPHIGDKIKLVYNDYFLDVTYVNNDLTGEKFLQSSYTWEISVRRAKVNGGLSSVNADMQELVDLFDFNINRGSNATDVNTLASGVAPTVGTDPESNFPNTTGKGKPKILFTPQASEKPSNYPKDGF